MASVGDTKGRVDEWNSIKVVRMQLYDKDLLTLTILLWTITISSLV